MLADRVYSIGKIALPECRRKRSVIDFERSGRRYSVRNLAQRQAIGMLPLDRAQSDRTFKMRSRRYQGQSPNLTHFNSADTVDGAVAETKLQDFPACDRSLRFRLVHVRLARA